MKNEKQIEERLAQHRTTAPDGFTNRVMTALPEKPRISLRDRCAAFWPSHGRWIAPALAGAAATLVILLGIGRTEQPIQTAQMTIHFQLHAPAADSVELLGTFNGWKSGDIVLNGPDASGFWTAQVPLPEGRHEYAFLVDGERWIADPKATTQRPDGFGRVNTVIKVYDNEEAA